MIEGKCQTTAMGIMPHTDVDKALDLALGLDIPFWPQLPRISFYEDMYVQTSQHFPGIVVDHAGQRITFDRSRFMEELGDYSERMAAPDAFALTGEYSAVFHRFLDRELGGFQAVRGQLTGPVSFGFRVVDENTRPIIYDEDVRALLFDFIQKKASLQYRQLRERNQNAFVWLDEPGLGWVFSGLSGYDDVRAREEYHAFMEGIEGPRALHLCANVNLPYLLELGVDILSFDAYQMETMPRAYAQTVAGFLDRGGIISWGIVPTDSENLARETPQTLAGRLSGYWEVVAEHAGLPARRAAEQALIAPARCCLKNIGQVGALDDARVSEAVAASDCGPSIEERLVERGFGYLGEVSRLLRARYGL